MTVNPPRHDPRRQDRQGRRSRPDHRRQDTGRNSFEMDELCRKIVLVPSEGQPLAPDLFDGIAEEAAKVVAKDRPKTNTKTNTSHQLRRFYDELLRWEAKVNDGDPEGAKDRLREHLPFIRMMNAKAAYAKGRNLVGTSFVALLGRCLEQVNDDPDALRNGKLFFEAFMGFYKLHDPKG